MQDKMIYGQSHMGIYEYKPFDCYCPMMSDPENKKDNYWKENCLARQKDPSHSATCYPICKAERIIEEHNTTMSNKLGEEKTKKRNAMIVEMAASGMSRAKIAKQIGVCASTVSRAVTRAKEN